MVTANAHETKHSRRRAPESVDATLCPGTGACAGAFRGLTEFLSVLDAQRNLFVAQVSLVQSLRNFIGREHSGRLFSIDLSCF